MSLESPSDSDSSSVEQDGLNLNFSIPNDPAYSANPGEWDFILRIPDYISMTDSNTRLILRQLIQRFI